MIALLNVQDGIGHVAAHLFCDVILYYRTRLNIDQEMLE